MTTYGEAPALSQEQQQPDSPLNSWEDMDKEIRSFSHLRAAKQQQEAASPSSDTAADAEGGSERAVRQDSTQRINSTEDGAPLADDLVRQGMLQAFLKERLEGPQERVMILRLEAEMLKFIGNRNLRQLTLPANMSGYQRNCATHVAEYYRLRTVATQDVDGRYKTSFFKTKVHQGKHRLHLIQLSPSF